MLAHLHAQWPTHLLEPIGPPAIEQPVAGPYLNQLSKKALWCAAIFGEDDLWELSLDFRRGIFMAQSKDLVEGNRVIELRTDLDNACRSCCCVQ